MTFTLPARRRRPLTFFAVACVALLPATRLLAQAPEPGKPSSPQYEIIELPGQKVAMEDGIRLSVNVYRPAAAGRFPVIVCITPYSTTSGPGRFYAVRGYAYIMANSRGRYDSEGDWSPYHPQHKRDGYALVQWAAAQSWSNAHVGMEGASYNGSTQWWTASEAPPALKAIIPFVAPPDAFENTPYQNGVLQGWCFDWAAAHSGRVAKKAGEGAYHGWTPGRADALRHTPYIDLNRARGADAPWFRDWYTNNLSTDVFWRQIAYQGQQGWAKIKVPSLNVTGWFDANHPGGPMNFVGMRKFGATPEARRPSLIIGPWVHSVNRQTAAGIDFGKDAVIDLSGYKLRWLDRYLKGIENGVERDPPVFVFVMGENRWHAEQDWPLPQTKWTKYYFAGGGRANAAGGDGGLTTKAPEREIADSYTYDPRKPTEDAFHLRPDANGHIDGPVDTRPTTKGRDVLVYRTPPLEDPVEVAGPIEAKLFASTSARDTDWMVRLVDVRPDGYAALLTEGVMRARCRNPDDEGRFTSGRLSPIEPGKVYEYTIRFWKGTGNLFQKGHRIQVEISSSWFPFYAPNLNTGGDNVALARMAEAVVATQRIYHGGRYPSHLVLPVIPTRKPGASAFTTRARAE